MNILSNFSLRQLNTFGIGAVARFYTELFSEEDLLEILHDKNLRQQAKFILGGGSNLLFVHEKLDYLVLKNSIPGIQLTREDDQHVYIRSGAGENWNDLVTYCIQHNYGGIENLSLIPGKTGASPMQNIGAYGVELKDCFHELEAIHLQDKRKDVFRTSDCRFGYRESVFKRELKDQYIITSVTLKLNKHPLFNTSYGAIQEELERMGTTALSVAAIGQAVCNIRRSKLPDPLVIGNAGSFFKNPEIPKNQFESLRNNFPNIVHYPLANGNVKLAAGWLIEQCGWKGKSRGNAGVHSLQALVLVNLGNATGQEIFDLSEEILQGVFEKFGVRLEREVNIL